MLDTPAPSRLQYFPIAFFSMVMGLAGMSIAWQKAQHVLQLNLAVGEATCILACGLFVVLLALYLSKTLRHKAAVLQELRHPVKLNFFPTISISLILLSIGMLQTLPGVSGILWVMGASLHLLFTLYVIGVWIHHEHFEVHHINPAWFIPVVGNALVPIAGVPLGFHELSWFFFSIGMVFWIVLLCIIFYRVLFHHPLDDKLMPTFFILIAPPAVGFIAYFKLVGELDGFARILYYCGLFLTLLLFTQASRFLRLKFFLSWWAYSFPLAAITVATLLMYESTGLMAFAALGWLLLSLLTLIVVYLLYRTALAVSRGKICLPEG
jgi:tellurite resistance protein